MGKMDGMVAAVTGGASGIGEATVRRFIAVLHLFSGLWNGLAD